MQMPWFRYKRIIARKRDNGSKNFILGRIKLHWWLTGIAFVFIISWLIFPSEYRKQLVDMGDFKLGEKSPKSVFANINFSYREAIESDAEKQQVIASMILTH